VEKIEMFKWVFIGLVSFILLFNMTITGAQQSSRMVVQTTADPKLIRSNIPVLKTKSGDLQTRSPERLRHKSRSTAMTPAPLDAAYYKSLTGRSPPKPDASLNLGAPETPRLDYLQLSVRHSYSCYGWLDFNEIRHIDAKNNSAQFYTATDPGMAWTRAHLKVEAGERYLIDFSVGTSRKTTFTVGASSSQDFTVDKGNHHLLLYLDAKSTSTSLVTLTSDNADYSFHTLDVTRIE
jgi:hypothetical protein